MNTHFHCRACNYEYTTNPSGKILHGDKPPLHIFANDGFEFVTNARGKYEKVELLACPVCHTVKIKI